MAIVGKTGGGPSTGFLGFKPSDILGMVMHFDASVFSSLTLTPITDAVQQWDDLSGNGHHAVQGNVVRQPAYNPIGFNGLPSLDCNVDFMNTGFILPANYSGTAFCVWRTAPVYNDDFGPYGALRSNERYYMYTNSSSNMVVGYGSGGFSYTAPPVNSLIQTTHLIDDTAGHQNLYQTGVQKVTDDPRTTTTPIEEFYLFAVDVNGNAARFLNGTVAEFILYDNVISNEERLSLEGNLKIKWGDLLPV